MLVLNTMQGRTGHWGTPFTKATANAMRERGLAVRRAKAAEKLIKAAMEADLAESQPHPKPHGAGVSQPTHAQAPPLLSKAQDAGAEAPTQLPKPTPADPTKPLEWGLGYALAPGEFVEATPPAKLIAAPGTANAIGELKALRARAQARRAQMLAANSG